MTYALPLPLYLTPRLPVLKRNFKMQWPDNEANSDLLTHTVSSQITRDFSSHRDRSQQKFEYRGKSGACNVCFAPCSSCFHLNKVLMNSTDESAGEICAENIVVDRGKQLKTAKLSEMSTMSGLHSSSDCFSENAIGKASSKTFDAYASDDNVVHSKFEDRRVLDGQDDCLSCVSGADERANRESDIEIDRIKCSTTQSKSSGQSSDKVFSSSSQIGLNSQNSGSVKIPSSEVTNDRPLTSSPNKEVALDDVCAEATAMAQKPIKDNGDLEVGIQPTDETDESDMVEHDVKVCDICGDAGREELLAICCLCSDGAEHTYCMREMRDEVPEGDWLCEECRSTEQVRNERQEKIDGHEKNSYSGQASGENVNSSEVEGPRTKGYLKINGKRLRDDADAEVSSVVKRPAVESSVQSPKPSNSSRTATLSRELSLKNLDKNILQPQLHSSSDTVQVNSTPDSEIIASDIRVKDARGTFSKSNSFNSLSSKPKVKLVDQVVFQRQKSAREHSSFLLKEGVGRSIGKSISFTSLNSGRAESKTGTLSPRLSFIRDSRTTKQRSSVERHNSFRKEHPSIKSATNTSLSSISRIEKKLASKDVSSSLTSITNHHEAKPVRTDGIGAFKRPSAHGHTAVSVSSASGDNSEQKHNQINPKEDLTPRSSVAEKAPFNANEGLHDGLSRPNGSSNSGGRVSGARFRPPGSKSSVGENDTLKAAIEAAVLRKPELYRKHRPLGQSDNSSMSTVGCEITSSQERVSMFAGKKQFSVSAELPDGVLPLDGNNFSRDMLSNVPEAIPFFLKSLAVPEHEYIWQGSFEICRSGNVVDLCDGLQAHLSTLASPKVNEAANKFNSRIVLYEVPRLSTWPVQFQENGVREDNIGIFFFAKDLESYDKIYKVLLDNMMKNDLALKGDINGVELLIFPSNQLPDNVQRWNMLFFLWAIFREKKESCLQPMPESIKQVSSPRDIHPAIMSLSESRISVRPVAKDLAASDDTAPVHKVPAAGKLWSLLSSRTVNRDRVTKLPSLDRLNSKLNSSSSAASDDGKQSQEPRGNYLEGGISPSYGSHLQVMGTAGGSGRDQMPINLDTPLDRQQSSHPSNNKAAATCDMAEEGRIHEITLDRRTSNQDILHNGNNADDLLRNGETPLREDRDTIDLNMVCVEPPDTTGADVACNELCLAFEKVNHEVTGSHILENLRNEACDKMDILMYEENGERHIFPTESRPLVSALWKTSPLEQDSLFERAPSLELALGAESKPLSFLSIQPLLMDKKVNDDHVPNEVGTTADDDVSASLSLSLSFPFPEKDP